MATRLRSNWVDRVVAGNRKTCHLAREMAPSSYRSERFTYGHRGQTAEIATTVTCNFGNLRRGGGLPQLTIWSWDALNSHTRSNLGQPAGIYGRLRPTGRRKVAQEGNVPFRYVTPNSNGDVYVGETKLKVHSNSTSISLLQTV